MRKGNVLISVAALVLVMAGSTGTAVAEVPGGAHPAPAAKSVPESPSGSYIVVMKQDPLITSVAASGLATPSAQAKGDALDSSHSDVLVAAGVRTDAKVQDYQNALNGFSAVVSHDQAVAMAANPKVAVVLPDELRQVTQESTALSRMDSRSDGSRPDDLGHFLGLTSREGAWRNGLTGEGVVVGVIDTGVWPEHASFADDASLPAPTVELDGSQRSACDFGNTAHNPNDAPFACNNKLIGARMMLDTYRAVQGS